MGVATQNPELRKRFQGKPEYVVNFMRFIAQELREHMAKLGVRTVEELVGRSDLLQLRASAAAQGIPLVEGVIHSSDVFYRHDDRKNPTYWELLRDEKGCVAVEMESFALFHNAAVLGKKAACILTISDSFVSPEITTPEQRQTTFTNMMKIALGAEV